MDSIGFSISKILKDLKLKISVEAGNILNNWENLVGENIAKNTRPLFFKEGIIHVEVTSASWNNEIRFFKEEIIENYNKHFNSDIVKGIEFSVKKNPHWEKPKPTLNKANMDKLKLSENDLDSIKSKVIKTEEKPKVLVAKELSSQDKKVIEYQSSKVGDEELRKKLKNFFEKARQRELLMLEEGWKRCTKCKIMHKEKEDLCKPCKFADQTQWTFEKRELDDV